MLRSIRTKWVVELDNELLDGFYLNDLLVEPLTGQVNTAAGPEHLPSKAVEVLLVLAKHPRRLVTREELIARVWGEGHGSSEALSHAISEIRHALDDHAATPAYIQTVPTRGYRLLIEPKPVKGGGSAPEPSSSERGFWGALVRHGVIQASAAYLVSSWLLIQVADATFDNLGLPSWAGPFVTFTIIGGFPIVVLLSWFFEYADGRLDRDRGDQSGGLLQGLERNYIAIFMALGIALAGASVYQATIGFDVAETATADVVDPLDDPALVPVEADTLAVLQLATFDDNETAIVFAKGLSEDLIDGLARLPGLRVSSRGDSWSLPPNAASETVRRRLRVAHYVEGSVRLDDNQLRVVIQLIDSENGFHVVSRSFEYELADFRDMQSEIARLVVANLRPALDQEASGLALLVADTTDPDAYVYYRQGLEILDKPRTRASIAAATKEFWRALELDPGYPAAHAGLCTANTALFELSRDPDDIGIAERACGEAFSVAPQLSQVLRAVGRLYLVTGKNAEANQAFRQALEINDQDAVALRGLASIARRSQDFERAEELAARAIELQPGNWKAISALGNLYFRIGRYADAAGQYQKAVYLSPENYAALGNLGSASLMAGQFDLARRAIERSLEIETNPTFLSNLGIVHYYLGDFEKAVQVQRRVVELSPDTHASWLNLGDALYFAGETEAATEAFLKAAELSEVQLSINPSDPEAMTLLAWSRAMTGDIDESLELAARAVSVDPGDPYSHYYLALTRLKSGQENSAVDAIEDAIANGYSANMLAAEPYLQKLQSDPRFARILAEAGYEGEK